MTIEERLQRIEEAVKQLQESIKEHGGKPSEPSKLACCDPLPEE
jgi:predicted RNase H-like HicB family nuclease